MADTSRDDLAARQVELAVSRLESLCVLPCAAARLLRKLSEGRFSPSDLNEIIASEPALLARFLRLFAQEGVSLGAGESWLGVALERLPAEVVREAILSVEIAAEGGKDEKLSRKDLVLHSLGVACCAANIARISGFGVDPNEAYCAGLLHDMGKLALQDVMPRSVERIVEQARATGRSLLDVERAELGVDHSVLGKRLARRWRLPGAITLAIWLHHGNTGAIRAALEEVRTAQIVQLADLIARRSGVGQSGSDEMPEGVESKADLLGLDMEQLDRLARDLLSEVAEKSNVLGVDSADALLECCRAAGAVAAALARQQSEIARENRAVRSASSHLDFLTDFVTSIDSAAEPIEVAESFAVRWQRFYQTGAVCLYLAPLGGEKRVDAIVVGGLGRTSLSCVEAPDGSRAIPEAIAGGFAILNAHEHLEWLLEQLDVEFEAGSARLVPLLCGGRAVGGLVFELHYPGDAALFEEKFERSSCVGGAVLGMALAGAKEQDFAERFACVVSDGRVAGEVREGLAEGAEGLEALEEMAAGAAHELNNPLAVVLGRAQLLAEAETDARKKEALDVICEGAREAAAIVEALMGYAEPPSPRPARTDVGQMVEESLQLAKLKTGSEHVNIQVEVGEGAREVFVDSGQVASAVANIIANAIESYEGQLGPIKVKAERGGAGGMVKLQVMDLGCGMDSETVRKAMFPFFSAKGAGRKRGMGLAYARRFLEINGGKLAIESRRGTGTTATIYLPAG